MGWLHEAISNTGSPCISVLRVNGSQATNTDIGLHTFRPCLFKPSSPSSAGNRKVCDRFDTGCGTLHMSIPSEPPTAKDCRNILNAQFFVVVKLRMFRLGLCCHRSSGSWAWSLQRSCCRSVVFQVPTFRYHGAWTSERRPHTPYCVCAVRGVW